MQLKSIERKKKQKVVKKEQKPKTPKYDERIHYDDSFFSEHLLDDLGIQKGQSLTREQIDKLLVMQSNKKEATGNKVNITRKSSHFVG